MSWVFIQPSDVWFFRDGRPFFAGENTTANSMFPPAPFTLQGALRSLILGHSAVDWRDFHEQRDHTAQALGQQIGYPAHEKNCQKIPASLGTFDISGPLLARESNDGLVERIVQLPFDAYNLADNPKDWKALRPTRSKDFERDWTDWTDRTNLAPLWPANDASDDPPEGEFWMNEEALQAYLNDNRFRCFDKSLLFSLEPRLGIGMDFDRRRPIDRLLYQSQFVRTKENVGLLVNLGAGVSLPEPEGVMSFGGEARAAYYKLLDSTKVVAQVFHSFSGNNLKIVLLTPAWFTGGWQPQNGDWSTIFGGGKIDLISASLGRPVHLGGWDVAAGGHKPMRAFVPAGSVYFFESEGPITLPVSFTQTPAGELSLSQQGFGCFVAGAWKWQD